MLFISPPFGTYISFLPKTIPIKGSYTVNQRTGLISQILKTLRYSFEKQGWINKIGLRNKGINHAIKNYNPNSIVSIAILEEKDIETYTKQIPSNMNIEINVSCPNAAVKAPLSLKQLISEEREWCIVKLSPFSKNSSIDSLYELGFRQFHCCNTIPTERGGLSGISLIPYVEEKIKYIKQKYPDTVVIGGGGIRNIETLKKYKNLGADHFAVSTLLFNPFLFLRFYYHYHNFIQNENTKIKAEN